MKGREIPIKNLMETLEPIDSVNHPKHYTFGNIETIDIIQDKMTPDQFEGYCIGNALKYVTRYSHKGGYEDLKKAVWYLNRAISAGENK